MRCKREHTLDPLQIFSTTLNFKWTNVEHVSFITMKKIVGLEVQLSYSNLREIFSENIIMLIH